MFKKNAKNQTLSQEYTNKQDPYYEGSSQTIGMYNTYRFMVWQVQRRKRNTDNFTNKILSIHT